ncbi:hypothetical protein EVAR_4747_1 [Eumeta japonica]|uniref:Uncharacterized protein n=1 Tax=Eumeta variegata TaxID=151549 RepID=A0A4C1SYN0_EUMVA|nr:hypothetical protein EVAR_4747_1 [Eumeta japonica]
MILRQGLAEHTMGSARPPVVGAPRTALHPFNCDTEAVSNRGTCGVEWRPGAGARVFDGRWLIKRQRRNIHVTEETRAPAAAAPPAPGPAPPETSPTPPPPSTNVQLFSIRNTPQNIRNILAILRGRPARRGRRCSTKF